MSQIDRKFDEIVDAIRAGGGSTDGGTFTSSSSTGVPAEGVYQATPTTVADGKLGVVRISTNRALKVDQDTLLAGEDLTNNVLRVERYYTNYYVTLASLTTIKTGSGFSHRIVFGHESCPTLTVYDSLTGSGAVLNIYGAGFPRGSYVLDNPFATGYTLVFQPGIAPSVSVAVR